MLHIVSVEKHVENEMEEGLSLNTVLDVIRNTRQRQCKCTFEHICATLQEKHIDIHTHDIAALLEQAVTEKVVRKRVANNVSIFQMLDSYKHGRPKLSSNKISSLVLSQLSDEVVSTLSAAGSTDSKRSLSLKCIEQQISSERKIHVPEDFNWNQNMKFVCKRLVTRGVLRQQGTQYHLMLDARYRKPSASCSDGEVTRVTRGQKQNHAEDRAVSSSSGNNSKVVSGSCCVIGEVYPSQVSGKPCKRNDKHHDTVQKAVVVQKTRTLLHQSKGAGLKTILGQMPKRRFGGKILHHRKCQRQSSAEHTIDASVEPYNHRRKLLKRYKQLSNVGSKQSDRKGHIHFADDEDKTSVAAEDANTLSAFSTKKLKHSSGSLRQNVSEVVQSDESCDGGKRHTRRSIRNRALDHKFVPTDDVVAVSVTDSLSSLDQQLTSYGLESQPADINSVASPESSGKENSGGSLGNTRETPSCQPVSSYELHGNKFNEVKKLKASVY